MQPYFMPYLGYFSLIKHTDDFILFDVVQFIRHGWIERNRILHPAEGWQYIQIPLVKAPRETVIKDMRIHSDDSWKTKMLSQLQHYRQKRAPHYSKVIELLQEIFSWEYEDIVSLNQASLKTICNYLGIERDFPIFSKMNLEIEPVNAPDEWALNICKALGNVEEYWNPPGGQEFFDRSKYERAGIALKFHSVNLSVYPQYVNPFESGLSILDVLMFNSSEETNRMLDDFSLF
jgi:hypothetical protein